jgi:hypothetical protein
MRLRSHPLRLGPPGSLLGGAKRILPRYDKTMDKGKAVVEADHDGSRFSSCRDIDSSPGAGSRGVKPSYRDALLRPRSFKLRFPTESRLGDK